jgi:hypothetical protein
MEPRRHRTASGRLDARTNLVKAGLYAALTDGP